MRIIPKTALTANKKPLSVLLSPSSFRKGIILTESVANAK